MSRYEPRISGNVENGFYALVVRIDSDGEESVIHGYKGRHFASHKAALKSTTRYINR